MGLIDVRPPRAWIPAADDEAFRFDGLAPRTDGLFLKLSYLFRN